MVRGGRSARERPKLYALRSSARPLATLGSTLIFPARSGFCALVSSPPYCLRQRRMAFMYYRAADSGHKDVYAALPLINASPMSPHVSAISHRRARMNV